MEIIMRLLFFMMFFVSCAVERNENSEALSLNLGNGNDFRSTQRKFESLSNFMCRVPFFTQSYADAVANAEPVALAPLMDSLNGILSEGVISELAVASLSEFAGKSVLTHSNAVTKAINVTSPISSEHVLQAIHKLPESSIKLLQELKYTMALNSATDEKAYRMLLFKLKSVNFSQNVIKGLSTNIPVPSWLQSTLNQASSGIAQGLNVLGYLGMFCVATNTAAAGFEALASIEESSQSKDLAETIGNDACARLNSHPSTRGKLPDCVDTGGLSHFKVGTIPDCQALTVSSQMTTGAPIFGDANLKYQTFRVGNNVKKNMKLALVPGVRVKQGGKGYVIVQVKVDDDRAANNGGVGWSYVGSLSCQ